MITRESIPFRRNPEASGIINGYGTMMVNGRQAWDMRELGHICPVMRVGLVVSP